MKKLIMRFIEVHGERLVFGTLAALMAISFRYIGLTSESNVILTGLAMLCFNKTRGAKTEKNDPIQQ